MIVLKIFMTYESSRDLHELFFRYFFALFILTHPDFLFVSGLFFRVRTIFFVSGLFFGVRTFFRVRTFFFLSELFFRVSKFLVSRNFWCPRTCACFMLRTCAYIFNFYFFQFFWNLNFFEVFCPSVTLVQN